MKTHRCLLVLLVSSVMISQSTASADSVRQINLREMCQQAEKIFRGTVVSALPGTVHVGGGELQVVTYRIRVEESFKGDFRELKGMRFAEVRMLSPQQINRSGSSRVTTYLPGMPQLIIGQPYLLFVSRANSVGLSPPVGLGRGLFRIRGEGPLAEVLNEYGNRMLLKDSVRSLAGQRGQINESMARRLTYSQLADQIRASLR